MIAKIRSILNKMTILQIVLVSFFSINILGGLLLTLPLATQSGKSTALIDAFFTATSALSVTGQITVDTATHWNYFGKTVILVLMEIGGLGVMTIFVFFFFFLGKRLNIRQHRVIQETLNISDISQTGDVVRYVLKFSLIVQTLGSVALSFDFVPRYGWFQGIYFAVFHSVSSFCSGGFDLFGDSLLSFQDNPWVMLTVCILILFGGLGFIVWRDIFTFRKNRKLLLHTRLVLVSMTVIMAIGMITLWWSESHNGTFSHIAPHYRWIHYLFLTLTPTTAGFANVDYQHVSLFGLFMTLILMFIGGAPGSTAGGIKVTTVAVVFIYLVANIRNQQPTFSHRAISDNLIKRSLFIALLGLLLICGATLLLLATETIPEGRGIEYVLMEVVSSFATAGLSLGMTPHLSVFGKVVLMFLMFVGRVGLVTFFWSSGSHKKEVKIRYPEENVLVG